ncbi:MAG: thiol-disulfide oxidoreductase DCC family protein [Bacteroidota bacterium]
MYTILFDGVCNFCNATINYIIDHDKAGKFVFAPLQSEVGQQLLAAHHYEANKLSDDRLRSVVLIKDGKAYEKSDAALEIARNLAGLWPLLYGFKIVPRFIRDFFYDLVARNRYRWFGKQESCRLPTPEMRQRFLA